MKIVTGHTGTDHLTANDMQAFNQGIFGTGNYVLDIGSKFAATITDSTHISIADGEGVMQGVHFRIARGQSDTVNIDAGTTGTNRMDLICARYQKNASTGVESVSLVVIKGTGTSGTPTAPEITSGDIVSGDLVADFPLYSVELTGVNLDTPVAVYAVAEGEETTVSDLRTLEAAVETLRNTMGQILYPVGSIYMSVEDVDPSELFGGTWERWGAGRVPVGVNTSDTDFDTVEKTGGEKKHTLTVAELAAHTHSTLPLAAQRGNVTLTFAATGFGGSGSSAGYQMSNGSNDYPSSSTGGGSAHNILQPYITCYMWKRTA